MELRDVRKLAAARVYLSACADDPGWDGRRDLSMRVFFPNANDVVRLVSDRTPLYVPQWPNDWTGHPLVANTLELIYCSAHGRLVAFQAGVCVFLLDPRIVPDILTGRKTEVDVLRSLEKSAR